MMDYRDVTVEKEDLNERESLELITRMIQNTKCRMAENAGMPFLLWGYMTVAVSLLVWFMLKQTGNADWNYLWFLLPLVAFPGTLWSGRKRKKMVRTYVDRIIGYVWTVFGLSAFLLSCVAVFGWDIPILFTILLLMGMGTALTGLIVGMKVVAVGGNEESRHGIILTKNEIASKYGLVVGEPLWKAKQKCRNLIIVPPNFPVYIEFSKKVRKILEDYTDLIEPFGLDESWIDVTGDWFKNGREIGFEIKERK